jgi:tRNA (mo5U34)-methyltransferase
MTALQSMSGEFAPWFHNLHLPDGTQTAPDHPLGDFPTFKWREIEPSLSDELRGKLALDIGCNAGFYSFELAARGAQVLAIDTDEHYLGQARWAAEHLDPSGRVEFRQMSVYDLTRVERQFDLVLFLGVLYHLRHPLLALDIVSERVRDRLILQTMTMPDDGPPAETVNLPLGYRDRLTEPGWPRAAFIENRLAGDPTNWWVPDHACVEAMLRSAGLRVLGRPAHEVYVCEPVGDRADQARGLRRQELRAIVRQG